MHSLFTRNATLLLLMSLHCVASLFHFAHNAIYLHDYPNLPASITVSSVWLVWAAITVVGVVGYGLVAAAWERTGLFLVGLYALTGFAGLDHYVLAPVSAHTVIMNASILSEVTTATLLLLLTLWRAWQPLTSSVRVK